MTARLLMTAAEVERYPARWKQTRTTGITASEVAAMLGICNPEHGSPFALFCAKTDPHAEDVGDKDAMARGRYLEPYVAERYAGMRPELGVREGGLYCSDERSWQMATFDRLAIDLERFRVEEITHEPPPLAQWFPSAVYPVEIKTSATRHGWGDPGSDQIPDPYRAQVLMQMDVWDAELVLIPVLFMTEWKVIVYAVKRDDDTDKDIKLIRDECERFMNRIADNDPPPIDWTPATSKALKTIMPVRVGSSVQVHANTSRKYIAAWRKNEAAKQRLRLAVNELLAASDGADDIYATYQGEQVKIAARRTYDRTDIDRELLRDKYPDIARECETKTPVDAIWPGRWTKERNTR